MSRASCTPALAASELLGTPNIPAPPPLKPLHPSMSSPIPGEVGNCPTVAPLPRLDLNISSMDDFFPRIPSEDIVCEPSRKDNIDDDSNVANQLVATVEEDALRFTQTLQSNFKLSNDCDFFFDSVEGD